VLVIQRDNEYYSGIKDIQLAVGLVEFRKLDVIMSNKQRVLETYKKNLAGLKNISFIEVEPGSDIIPFRVAIIAEKAHELMAYMDQNGVVARTFFYPMHKQPSFQQYANYNTSIMQLTDESYPNSTYAYDNGVCLPTYAALKDEEIDYVCSIIKNFYEKQ